jgi:hypothetical protein
VTAFESAPTVRIREVKSEFDWKPWLFTLAVLVVIGILIANRRQNSHAPASTETTVSDRTPAKPISKTPLVDMPSAEQSGPAMAAAMPIVTHSSTPAKQDTTTDTSQDDTQSTDTAVASQPTSNFLQIQGAAIASDMDDNGNMFAVGHVVIQNRGSQDITNYNISLNTGDGLYTLSPFTGSMQNPQALTTRRIPAGGSVDVPVMTEDLFQTTNPSGEKTVTVTASEGGVSASNSLTIQ